MLRWLSVDERHPMNLIPRPVLYIEDEPRDVFKFLEALVDKEVVPGDVLEACTVMLLATPKEDTHRDIVHLLCKYPQLQIAALQSEPRLSVVLRKCCEDLRAKRALPNDEIGRALQAAKDQAGALTADTRYADLERVLVYEEHSFTDSVSSLLRPGGIVVCDLLLRTLKFPTDRENEDESEKLLRAAVAAGVACSQQNASDPISPRQQPAQLSVLSGMREFLSVGVELRDRNVKIEDDMIFLKLRHVGKAATTVAQLLRMRFPWRMTVRQPKKGEIEQHRVGDADIPFIESCLDLILWPCVASGRASGLAMQPGGHNYSEVPAAALRQLVDGHLRRSRVAVLKNEIRTDGQQSPEQVISTIRRRLCKPVIPDAFEGKYQLCPEMAVARCEARL